MTITSKNIKNFIDEQHKLQDFDTLTQKTCDVVEAIDDYLSCASDDGVQWDLFAIAHTPSKQIKVCMYSEKLVDFTLDDLQLLDQINSFSVELHARMTWNGILDEGARPHIIKGTTSTEILAIFENKLRDFLEQESFDLNECLESISN